MDGNILRAKPVEKGPDLRLESNGLCTSHCAGTVNVELLEEHLPRFMTWRRTNLPRGDVSGVLEDYGIKDEDSVFALSALLKVYVCDVMEEAMIRRGDVDHPVTRSELISTTTSKRKRDTI